MQYATSHILGFLGFKKCEILGRNVIIQCILAFWLRFSHYLHCYTLQTAFSIILDTVTKHSALLGFIKVVLLILAPVIEPNMAAHISQQMFMGLGHLLQSVSWGIGISQSRPIFHISAFTSSSKEKGHQLTIARPLWINPQGVSVVSLRYAGDNTELSITDLLLLGENFLTTSQRAESQVNLSKQTGQERGEKCWRTKVDCKTQQVNKIYKALEKKGNI